MNKINFNGDLTVTMPEELKEALVDVNGRLADHAYGASAVTFIALMPDGSERHFRVGLMFLADKETATGEEMPEQVLGALWRQFYTGMETMFGEGSVEQAVEQDMADHMDLLLVRVEKQH